MARLGGTKSGSRPPLPARGAAADRLRAAAIAAGFDPDVRLAAGRDGSFDPRLAPLGTLACDRDFFVFCELAAARN